MIADLSPSMCDVLAGIGDRSTTAHEIGVNGLILKRLWEMGFLKLDMPREGRNPPYYSLSPKGEGAAAILTATPCPVEHEQPLARIKRTVAQHYRIPLIEMESARRSRTVARPRQVAMYLAKQLTPKSLPDIGRHFGGRDHTTVIHAVKVVERLKVQDHNFKDEIETLKAELVSTENDKSVDKSIVGPATAGA